MFRILIIEDENLAAMRLQNLLLRYDSRLQIQAKLPSVAAAREWLHQNAAPDLIFLDIHLEDGLGFRILEDAAISTPVVLTTAFEELPAYQLPIEPFAHLCKPIPAEELAIVLDRFRKTYPSADFQI